MSNLDALHVRAKALNLNGLLAHWGEAAAAGWLATLIDWEEQERTRRSLGAPPARRTLQAALRLRLDLAQTLQRLQARRSGQST